MHLVAWDVVCPPKETGGASIRSLQVMNKALLCKWLWRFGHKEESLWHQVIVAKFRIEEFGHPRVASGPYGCSL